LLDILVLLAKPGVVLEVEVSATEELFSHGYIVF
jgi:hypothetical protein